MTVGHAVLGCLGQYKARLTSMSTIEWRIEMEEYSTKREDLLYDALRREGQVPYTISILIGPKGVA